MKNLFFTSIVLTLIISFGAEDAFSQVTEAVTPNSMTVGVTITVKAERGKTATNPFLISTVTDASPSIDIILTADPKAVSESLILSIGDNPVPQYSISLYDKSNTLLFEKATTGNLTTLSMAEFPASNYFLKVAKEDKEIRIFSIVKN